MSFSNKIIDWFDQNKRNLPWRSTQNPYFIWLSEIILQQTRVAQGLPYYYKFVNKFKSIEDFANAEEQEILKLWQGLGYYSRARNMHFTAKEIVNKYNGIFPYNFLELKKLKGIGDYTAAAIASFAFNENIGVVDGNVYRVLARYFGVFNDISDSKTKKIFFDLVNSLLPKGKAADFNQSLMEFGALQCLPKNPNCGNCIFNDSCYALQNKKVNELPIKSKKVKVKSRILNYIWITYDNEMVLEQRTAIGIWKNLYQMPLFESFEPINAASLLIELKKDLKYESIDNLFLIEEVKHKLTHQHLDIKFWKAEISKKSNLFIWYKNVDDLPIPIIFEIFLKKNGFVK
ncbi:MAG: A/G-specific adenine glycosylase [Flavobacterium sp.]